MTQKICLVHKAEVKKEKEKRISVSPLSEQGTDFRSGHFISCLAKAETESSVLYPTTILEHYCHFRVDMKAQASEIDRPGMESH